MIKALSCCPQSKSGRWRDKVSGLTLRSRLQPVEWAGVREAAGHALVPGKGPDLKVVTPRGVRRGYPDRLGGNKAETTVEGRDAHQPHQRLSERVGSTQNGVHQVGTDSISRPHPRVAHGP